MGNVLIVRCFVENGVPHGRGKWGQMGMFCGRVWNGVSGGFWARGGEGGARGDRQVLIGAFEDSRFEWGEGVHLMPPLCLSGAAVHREPR